MLDEVHKSRPALKHQAQIPAGSGIPLKSQNTDHSVTTRTIAPDGSYLREHNDDRKGDVVDKYFHSDPKLDFTEEKFKDGTVARTDSTGTKTTKVKNANGTDAGIKVEKPDGTSIEITVSADGKGTSEEHSGPAQKDNYDIDRDGAGNSIETRNVDNVERKKYNFTDPSKNYSVDSTWSESGKSEKYSFANEAQNYTKTTSQQGNTSLVKVEYADPSKNYKIETDATKGIIKRTDASGRVEIDDKEGHESHSADYSQVERQNHNGTGFSQSLDYASGNYSKKHWGPDKQDNWTLSQDKSGNQSLKLSDGKVLAGKDADTYLDSIAPKALFNKEHNFVSLGGTVCGNQPERGQVPVVPTDPHSDGCQFASGDITTPSLNFSNIYEKVAPSSVRFESGTGGKTHDIGSGVMVAKNNDECLVVTDDHVAKKQAINPEHSATTSDGKQYPTNVLYQDPTRDLAVVSLKMGADADKVCKPAQFVKNKNEIKSDSDVAMLGTPANTPNLLLASAKVSSLRVLTRQEFVDKNNRPDGAKAGTLVADVDAPLKPGMSGGPAVTSAGKVWGVNEAANDSHGVVVLLDQQDAHQLIDHALAR